MKKQTHEEALYSWMQFVEGVVGAYNVMDGDITKGEGGEVLKGWIWVVFHNMVSTFGDQNKDRRGDGCLYQALMFGEVFFGWYFRTHLAKVLDKRRPIEGRRAGLKQIAEVIDRMIKMLELKPNAFDKELFKGVEWGTVEELFKK